uniref:long-chain-fatty-acid--CoA ligase n=1 Tax=Strigamia maritima TaxID=126957 RepID=T1J7B0_STRMM
MLGLVMRFLIIESTAIRDVSVTMPLKTELLGLIPFHAVGILASNSPEWIISHLAAMFCGGFSAGIYTTNSPAACLHVLENSSSNIVVVDNESQLDKILSVRDKLPQLKAIIQYEGHSNHPDVISSGTTGNPKGVMISHDNAVDVYLGILTEATIYCADPAALKGKLVEDLIQAQPTYFMGVPRVYEKFMEKLQAAEESLPTIKKILITWARKQALAYNLQIPHYDIVLNEAFGLSETSSHIMTTPTYHHHMGSAGNINALKDFKCKISNPNSDGSGEVMLCGPNIFMGYLGLEEMTKEALEEDKWLHTGDVGLIDKDGFLFVTGRIKELIVTSGGENVPPVLIEDQMKKLLPVLSNCMLIGDKRKYLTILLTLKTEVNLNTLEPTDELNPIAIKWCQSVSSSAKRVSEILQPVDVNVMNGIQQAIDKYNEEFAISRAQKIQKWSILPEDFSIQNGTLGPTNKLKRPFVVNKYSRTIESIGLPAGIYTTNSPDACFHVLDSSSANIVLVDTKEQLAKIMCVRHKLPDLKAIVQLEDNSEHPDIISSGTTGNPKVAMISHDSILTAAKTVLYEFTHLSKYGRVVSYLPLSHVAALNFDIYLPFLTESTVHFAHPEALKGKLVDDLLKAQPTYFVGVPRVFEKIKEKLEATEEMLSPRKKKLFKWARQQAFQYNQQVPRPTKKPFLYIMAKGLVLKKIKKAMGLENIEFSGSGGAPISAEVLEFFQSINIVLHDGFGLSECSGGHIGTLPEDYHRVGSVGNTYTAKNTETKIINPDIDGSGEINVLELIITSGGENVPPVFIEDKIKKLLPILSNCMLIGDKQKYLTIFLTLKTEINLNTMEPTDELNHIAIKWCQSVGSSAKRLSEILKYPDANVTAGIQQGIDQYNKEFMLYHERKKFKNG